MHLLRFGESGRSRAITNTCHLGFASPSAQKAPGNWQYVISTEEQRFWERMTFRQFAILIIRVQAVWLLFDAVVEGTYLSR